MTGLLNERELSRKTFLKGGGALIVGFSVLGSAVAGKASAASPGRRTRTAAIRSTRTGSTPGSR